MSRTFYPEQYFHVGSVWMASAFEQYAQSKDAQWTTMMYYYDNMTDEQKSAFLDQMSTFYQKESLSNIHYSLQYDHVQQWNKKHSAALNDTFKKALKRKRSMDGEVTLIVRWMNIVPDAVEWQDHLKGELATWENIPNKYCDPDDLAEIMRYLGQEHPKYPKVMAYYIDRLNKMEAGADAYNAFYDQHCHLICTKDDQTNSPFDDLANWLSNHPERLIAEWPTMNTKWQERCARIMVSSEKYATLYNPIIADTVHEDMLKKAIGDIPDALSYQEPTFAIQQFQRFFPDSRNLTYNGSHLIYRMSHNHLAHDKVNFMLKLLFDKAMPTMRDSCPYYYYQSGNQYAPIVDYGLSYLTQQSIGWIALYLILNTCVRSGSLHSYQNECKPVKVVKIQHIERSMLEQLMNNYPILESVLTSFQNTKGSNILLDVLKVISFSSKEKADEAQQTASLLLGSDLYTFDDAIFQKLRMRLVREEEGFYIESLETNYRMSRQLDDQLLDMLVDYVHKIEPLLADNLKDLNEMEEIELIM